jgi:hypothetical protein
MAAAMARIVTLDIPEVQIIVEYPLDAGGFFWHHRVLLKRVTQGVWMCLTPDMEVVRLDLGAMRHIVLERLADFPPPQAAYVYCFDPVSRATLEAKKRLATTQATLLGDGDAAEVHSSVWVIADARRDDFGQIVASELLNAPATGIAFETKGVVTLEGEEVFVERILASDAAKFKATLRNDDGDLRLLGDHRDGSGKRKLDLGPSVEMMRESAFADFPLAGDIRASKELLGAIVVGPGSLPRYHTEWARLSGISEHSALVYTHRTICEVLRLMHSYDQVDISNLASGEQLCRWLIQLETAVERNPRAPDFGGLDIFMGGSTSAEGKAMTSKFTEHISGKLKERAAIWKQERLYKEEKNNLGKQGPKADHKDHGGAGGGAGGGGGRGRDGGRGRGRGKEGRGRGGAGEAGAVQP